MKQPTPRQLYLLGFAEKRLITVSPIGSYRLMRPHQYMTPRVRHPSRGEIKTMLTRGWVRLCTDLSNPKHQRVEITHEGFVLLRASRKEAAA